MKKVALISLGCAKNLVDSEVMLGYLNQAHYHLTTDMNQADIIIINTCGFINPARREAESYFQDIIAIKNKAKDKKIIATGCYVEKDRKSLEKAFPEIDVWTGVKDFHQIISIIEGKAWTESEHCFLYSHDSPRILSTPRAWSYVKISEGCSHKCGFCTIPLIKGAYRSRDISSIVQEVQALVAHGTKEINLISQDSTYYGRDLNLKDGLPLLLKNLLGIPDLAWIRVLYAYPEEISDSLLDIMQADKICAYIDSPFQHSDPKILKQMGRAVSYTKAMALIQKIRRKLPDAALRTSIIVGFPGEGDQEFANLKSFINEARFDHLGVFTYSREKGTRCYHMAETVSPEEKEDRRNQIMQLQASISLENNQKYLHSQFDVLIEGRQQNGEKMYIGRTQYQAPEVDGVVMIADPNGDTDFTASIQKVEIKDCEVYDLYGNFIR